MTIGDHHPRVEIAQEEDLSSWLDLAREVEHLFGPMAEESGFHRSLLRCIERGSALCIREDADGPGAPLLAGLLFSAKPPQYKIGWLSVARRARRQGLGKMLVSYILRLVQAPAEVSVTTFGPDVDEGSPARRFYEHFGFSPAESTGPGPDGGSRQAFRLAIDPRGARDEI